LIVTFSVCSAFSVVNKLLKNCCTKAQLKVSPAKLFWTTEGTEALRATQRKNHWLSLSLCALHSLW